PVERLLQAQAVRLDAGVVRAVRRRVRPPVAAGLAVDVAGAVRAVRAAGVVGRRGVPARHVAGYVGRAARAEIEQRGRIHVAANALQLQRGRIERAQALRDVPALVLADEVRLGQQQAVRQHDLLPRLRMLVEL